MSGFDDAAAERIDETDVGCDGAPDDASFMASGSDPSASADGHGVTHLQPRSDSSRAPDRDLVLSGRGDGG